MRKAASMSRPAREERGMNSASGAHKSTVTATAAAENTPDHWLTAPACWLTADRVSDPDPGMHWNKLPARLAAPSLRHCWWMSSLWPLPRARALAMASASNRPSMAMAKALPASRRTRSQRRSGASNWGSEAGMAPTILTP